MGSKGSDTVASNHKRNNVYDGITNAQVPGLVDGIEPKDSGTRSNSKTIHQYDKTTLRSRKKSEECYEFISIKILELVKSGKITGT